MENGDDADVEDEGTGRKPRIRISMGKSSSNKVKVKRRRRRCKITGELLPLPPSSDEEDEEETTPAPPRKRRKLERVQSDGDDDDDDDDIPITEMKKKAAAKAKGVGGSIAAEGDYSSSSDGATKEEDTEKKDFIFTNVEHWKQEKEKLDGSFMAARALFTKLGPWNLPGPNTEYQFRLIVKSLISKMTKHDQYSVFADDVSDSEAPGYSEMISSPMNFYRMREKVETKAYGTPPDAFEKLYEDFLLIFDNCYAYNDADGEVVQEAARIFGLLPVTFAEAASHVLKKKKRK